MLSSTIRAIRDAGVCEDRWSALRRLQGFKWPDDKPGPLIWVLRLGTVDDFLWVLRVADPRAEPGLLVGIAADIAAPFVDPLEKANPALGHAARDIVVASRVHAAPDAVSDTEPALRAYVEKLLGLRGGVRQYLPAFDAVCLVAMVAIGGSPKEESEMLRDISRLSKYAANEVASRRGVPGATGPMDALAKAARIVASALEEEECRQAGIITRYVAEVEMPEGGKRDAVIS